MKRAHLDCGDNSCLYRDRTQSGGMRTNGGCSCFDMLPINKRRFVERTYQQLDAALAEVERLKEKTEYSAWATIDVHGDIVDVLLGNLPPCDKEFLETEKGCKVIPCLVLLKGIEHKS